MRNLKIYLIVFLLMGMLGACEDDELSNQSIFQDPDTTELTNFDYWLLVQLYISL